MWQYIKIYVVVIWLLVICSDLNIVKENANPKHSALCLGLLTKISIFKSTTVRDIQVYCSSNSLKTKWVSLDFKYNGPLWKI